MTLFLKFNFDTIVELSCGPCEECDLRSRWILFVFGWNNTCLITIIFSRAYILFLLPYKIFWQADSKSLKFIPYHFPLNSTFVILIKNK